MADRWQLWIDRKERVQGVCIVHRCADTGLKMMPNGLDERDRREFCEKLVKILNGARDCGVL
jgi:hypothetical protein